MGFAFWILFGFACLYMFSLLGLLEFLGLIVLGIILYIALYAFFDELRNNVKLQKIVLIMLVILFFSIAIGFGLWFFLCSGE